MSDRADEIRAELVPVAIDLLDDFDAIVDAARRFASLTSPETIEKHARVYHKRWLEDSDGWYPEAWDDLEDEDRQWYLDLSEAQLEAVLRSVEEGTQ